MRLPLFYMKNLFSLYLPRPPAVRRNWRKGILQAASGEAVITPQRRL
ncbi:hypothetical protein CLOSTASPAR_02397 [[Clostridium] asparagiforme DSM 15981]|uniref:Uncharacterized protein n=1 Tax=[Clostridium] asparagiforme DSM 15981 TaxID=518636 RepID=C0CZH0_9FIRM|nr:hypothetical protein CLOSTASPAR_02397 [[Clostridium] asparagiforme DSM 15981]